MMKRRQRLSGRKKRKNEKAQEYRLYYGYIRDHFIPPFVTHTLEVPGGGVHGLVVHGDLLCVFEEVGQG